MQRKFQGQRIGERNRARSPERSYVGILASTACIFSKTSRVFSA